MFVSGLYGLMRRILYVIFVAPYCKLTMTFVKHHVIENGSLWSFIFVCIVISEHEFISDIIVVVKLVSIFTDIIFNNLCLVSLTY